MTVFERYPFLRRSDVPSLYQRFGGIPRAPRDLFRRYWQGYRKGPPATALATPVYDLVFVLPQSSRGWVLEGICKDIARWFPGTWTLHDGFKDLPPARGYFYAHHSFFSRCLLRNQELWHRENYVFFTHPREFNDLSEDELVLALSCATRVLSMCSLHRDWLVARGVPERRVDVALAGADANAFLPHERGAGAVGLCSAFYPRKNPEGIHALVRELPSRAFILLGRGWEAYSEFDALKALPNLTYVEAPYSDYPSWYARMDVFLSPSQVEGGPIPLLEAMMCNVVPVASRTGFAPDLIRHGDNGYLFDPSAPVASVAALVERALSHRGDVSNSVRHLTWERYAQRLADQLDRHERISRWMSLPRTRRIVRTAAHLGRTATEGLRRLVAPASTAKPDADHTARGGGERQAASNLKGIRADHRARYAFAAALLDEPSRVLDMACGVGYGARILSESDNCLSVLAVDKSEEAVDYARTHYTTAGVDLRLGDVLKVRLDPAAFDVGVCFETLEHVDDDERLLRQFWSALKPGGRLILSTPNEVLLPFDPKRFPFHRRHYTAVQLQELVERSGFVLDQALQQATKHSSDVTPGSDGVFHVAVCHKPKA